VRRTGPRVRPKGARREDRTIGSASERPMNPIAKDMVVNRRPPTEGHGWVCGSVRRQVERSDTMPWSEGAGYK
jgi:hypothetical protein